MRIALSRLINTPLLVHPNKLMDITDNVSIKLLSKVDLAKLEIADVGLGTKETAKKSNGVGLITVYHSLAAKNAVGDSGITTYENIYKASKNLIESGEINTLIYHFDTPGGEANAITGLTDFIFNIPKTYGINTIAAVDNAYSAGQFIAAACQTTFTIAGGGLGSIGAVMSLIDISKLDVNMGVTYEVLRSRDHKALGNPHEPITDKVRASALEQLARVDTLFASKMLEYRNISEDVINELDGRTITGEEALKNGLNDGIISSLDEILLSPKDFIKSGKLISIPKTTGNIMTLEEMKSKIAELEAEKLSMQAINNTKIAEAINVERERSLAILKAGKELNIGLDTTVQRIQKGATVEDATEFFTALAEAVGKTSSLNLEAAGIKSSINKNLNEEEQKEVGFNSAFFKAFEAFNQTKN